MSSGDISDEVLEEMEEFVPLRQYHLTLFKPVVRLSIADHSPYHAPKQDYRKGKKVKIHAFLYIPSIFFEFCIAYFDEIFIYI